MTPLWVAAYLMVGFGVSVLAIRSIWSHEYKMDRDNGDWYMGIYGLAVMFTALWPLTFVVLLLFFAHPFFKWLYTPTNVRKRTK